MGTPGARNLRHFPRVAKWESFIGLQPVLVLTDNQAIESWTREILDPPAAHLADVLGGMLFFQI